MKSLKWILSVALIASQIIVPVSYAATSASVSVKVTVISGPPQMPSIVTTDGYRLMVQKRNPDGTLEPAAPYIMKGVCWSPASIGTPGPDGTEKNETGMRKQFSLWCDTDLPLIKQMNANTIRTFMDFGLDDTGKNWKYILDKCYENGIMVILPVDRSIADMTRIQQVVNKYKDHPAILMWVIGNEWNIWRFYGAFPDLDQSVAAAEAAAQLVKSLDPNHPVVSSYGDPNAPSPGETQDIIINRCPSFDVWAFNIYRGSTFTDLFARWKNICDASVRKPMYLNEFGCDAYDINKNREDQDAQRNWEYYQWDHIRRNLSAENDSRVCVGANVFEFSDEWWKAGDPDHQQPDGWYTSNSPDGHASEEWWGLATIDRIPRKAYYLFQQFYGGTEPEPPPPTPIVRFSTQPDSIVTNLANFPVMDVFENTSSVTVNGDAVTVDAYGGFRKDVTLAQGANTLTLTVNFTEGSQKSYQKMITYDPAYSVAGKKLVYAGNVVLDLDGNAVLGMLPYSPWAMSHDGKYYLDPLISNSGEAYSTADNSLVKNLNFTNLNYGSLFSNDDKRVYSGTEVLDFENNTLITNQMPISVSGSLYGISSDGAIFYTGSNHLYKVDPQTFQVVKDIIYDCSRYYFGGAGISKDGTRAFIASYAGGTGGGIAAVDVATGNVLEFYNGGLSDYMTGVMASDDGMKVFVGAFGNAYYGYGGVYVMNASTGLMDMYYPQYGAVSIGVSPEYVFATSTCINYSNGMKGSIYHRGIEVLKLNDQSELVFQKSFFLCYPADGSVFNVPIFYKKEYTQ